MLPVSRTDDPKQIYFTITKRRERSRKIFRRYSSIKTCTHINSKLKQIYLEVDIQEFLIKAYNLKSKFLLPAGYNMAVHKRYLMKIE